MKSSLALTIAVLLLGVLAASGSAVSRAVSSAKSEVSTAATHVHLSRRLDALPAVAKAPAVATAVAPAKVLFIGDSVMKAFRLDPAQAWPALIGGTNDWDVTNLACNGAGYLMPGSSSDCGTTFADVVANASSETPDIVIAEGSSNDFGLNNTELAAATRQTFALIRAEFPAAEIIGLSTVWGAEAIPDQLADTDSQVQAAVLAVNGTYIDIGQPFQDKYSLMQYDDVHPTVDGQTVLAADINPLVLSAVTDYRNVQAQLAAAAWTRARLAEDHALHNERIV